jgi:putative hydrolase of the HAD superfamily
LPQQRWIFTNADADHARRVISVLGLQECFAGTIDIRALDFACKPEPAAYRRALAMVGDPAPEACVLLDDSVSNLAGARQIGFSTVWVGQNGASHPAAQVTLLGLLDLPQKLPSLWSEAIEHELPASRTMNSPQ